MSAKTEARRKRRVRKKGRQKFGNKLNSFRPKSEVWFKQMLSDYDVRFPFEENITFGGYIPDFINKHYLVIVEVDGSIHNLPNVKKKDLKKQKRYESLGYTVLRVEAYNKNSLEECFEQLNKIRLSKPQI